MGINARVAAMMLRRSLLTALATTIVAATVSTTSAAQQSDTIKDPHDVQPERPTVATHAGTVAPGWFEIETGVERDRFAPSTVGVSTPTVLKLGVGSHEQLSVFGATSMPAGESLGIGDIGIDLKWRLVDDAPIVGDFAVLPSIKFPTGSVASGTGTGTTDLGLLLISSHDFGGVEMDLNAGYTRRSGDGTNAPRNATLWTASFGGPVAGQLGWVGECYGFPATTGPTGARSVVALLGGPTMLVRRWLAVDAGLIVPVAGPQPHALFAGGVWNVGQLIGRP